jgi:hypothetical protein
VYVQEHVTRERQDVNVEERIAEGRARKALAIVNTCLLRGLDADAAAHLTDAQRREVEQQAGVRKGSEATWRQAIGMLAGSSQPEALCPFCGHGDPEGVPGPPKPFRHDGPCAQ